MFSGAPTQPIQQPLEAVSKPINDKPQPQSKKEGTGRLSAELIKVCSHLANLQIQVHLVHLNYECSNFLGIHELTEKQYKKHSKQLDRVGELIRSLDYLLPMCAKGLLKECKGFNHIESYDPNDMLITYKDNLENFGMLCKKVIKTAIKEDAPDVEHYMAELIEDAFTASWKIKAGLRNRGSACSLK